MGIESSLERIEMRLTGIELLLNASQERQMTVKEIAWLYGIRDSKRLYKELRYMLPDYGKKLDQRKKCNKWDFSEVVQWNLKQEEHRRVYLGLDKKN